MGRAEDASRSPKSERRKKFASGDSAHLDVLDVLPLVHPEQVADDHGVRFIDPLHGPQAGSSECTILGPAEHLEASLVFLVRRSRVVAHATFRSKDRDVARLEASNLGVERRFC